MRRYRLGSHPRYDLKVHPVWVPKYRKRVLTGAVAVRVRDLLRQIAAAVRAGDHDARTTVPLADSCHPTKNTKQDQKKKQTQPQWRAPVRDRCLVREFAYR